MEYTHFKFIKKHQKTTTCDCMDLETLGILTDYARKSPGHCGLAGR